MFMVILVLTILMQEIIGEVAGSEAVQPEIPRRKVQFSLGETPSLRTLFGAAAWARA